MSVTFGVLNQTGEYTAERLRELAAATPSLPASKKQAAPASAAPPAAAAGLGVIKLAGSFKPAGSAAAGTGGPGNVQLRTAATAPLVRRTQRSDCCAASHAGGSSAWGAMACP